MTLILQKGSFIAVGSVELSEHNRGPAQIEAQMIGISGRTITGTMKRQAMTYKRKLSVSWERLPGLDSQTVDGMAGRNTLRDLYQADWNDNLTPYTITIREVDSSNEQIDTTFSAFIETYSEELIKRFSYQHWNVSMAFAEV